MTCCPYPLSYSKIDVSKGLVNEFIKVDTIPAPEASFSGARANRRLSGSGNLGCFH